MTTLELTQLLTALDITEGFAIRDGLIVLWENETEIPESLNDFVKLDVNE